MEKKPRYHFVTTTWHFPDGDDCYEDIDYDRTMTLKDALQLMILWLNIYPDSHCEEGMIVPNGAVLIECCTDICDSEQKSARIEVRYEEE